MARPTQADIQNLITALTNNTNAITNNTAGNRGTDSDNSEENTHKTKVGQFAAKMRESKKYKSEGNMKAANSAKASAYGIAAQEATKMVSEIIDITMKVISKNIERKQIEMKAGAEKVNATFDLWSKGIQKSMDIAIGGFGSSIQENSAKAGQAALEIGKTYLTTQIQLKAIEYNKAADLAINSAEMTKELVTGIGTKIGDTLSSIPNPYTAIIGGVVSIGSAIFGATEDYKIMQEKYKKEIYNQVKDFQQKNVEQVASLVEKFQTLATDVDKILMDVDKQAHDTARRFGFGTEQTENYVRAAAVLNKEMAVMGKTFEDLNKMQSTYITESGRNVLMNGKEGQMMSAFGKLYNISDEESAQIMGAMNIFNTSIESGSDIMFEMYKTANRMGVSNQKFAKDMQKNLKIAEKYQFKGGVKGMMNMALWAQKTRFNMDSLSGALEKMHTGNIADVIQTSAKLNVLGGNAALLSDPMAMLYNAYADPAQYAKNMQQMIQGFGHFNSKTGETEFNINEQMRMEAMASALGVSKEDFFNMARQEKKLGNIKKVLGGRFSSDETDFITQNATFNKDTGQWEVNVMGANGELQRRDINTLTQEELDSIFPEDNQQQLVEYTKGIFSILEKNTATEYKYRSELAYKTQGAFGGEYEKRRKITSDFYNDTNIDKLGEKVENAWEFNTNSLASAFNITQETLNTMLEDGHSIDELFYTKSLEGMQEIAKHVEDYGEFMRVAATNDKNRNEILLGILNKIDPILAGEWQGILDQDKAKTDMLRMVHEKNGNLSIQDIGDIIKDENRKEEFFRNFDVAGESDIETLSRFMTGKYQIKEGAVFDDKGRLIKLTGSGEGKDNFERLRKTKKEGGWLSDAIGDTEVLDRSQRWYGFLNPIRGFQGIAEGITDIFRNEEFIRKTNDLIISPKHGIYETDPEDTIVASKPGGSLDRSSQRRGGLSDNVTLNITGSLTLSNGSQKIDLMELLRNDPNALRELTKEIIKEGSNTVFGGKHEWAPNRYTFS